MHSNIVENLDLEKTSFRPLKWPRKWKPAKTSKLPKWPENCFEPFGKGGWPPISTWITQLPTLADLQKTTWSWSSRCERTWKRRNTAKAYLTSVWTFCMTPCQASLRRVDAQLAAILLSFDFSKMNAQVRPMSSTFTGFFSSLIAKVLHFFHTTVCGFGSIGGWGTQSTACSSFHACGRTSGKSPCLYVDSCHFFLKFWNNE